ncbi:signal recognition particle-docking protein FtsY [Nitrospina watsonii]|uniref:Signal recognition particle receptor FtsY n=1 Tax=Nitrospina watsonii TaxID=1323948 RepID=A0ABM9HFF6_9BACT|nr:signal recognition particle-docking protein FtsY [Nitrospina watsonii]CAI2718961.1 Signal recognition particle receptor FtsY [Nitrospina watsonii]
MNDSTENKMEDTKQGGFFSRLKSGLSKTRDSFSKGLDNLVHGKAQVGPEMMDEIEEALLIADAGMGATRKILDALKREVSENHLRTQEEVQAHLKTIMAGLLQEHQTPWDLNSKKPFIVLVIGINGSGKTTTIGKLAGKWSKEGKKVLVAAGDTFRAAAIEQLQMWSERANVPCIAQKKGADPSAVAYDAVQAGIARKSDIVLIDTAGRLQTNTNLMEELKKVKRVIGKVQPDAPHETILVLDGSIGQNSISQARLFHEALHIDSLVMTKLDGTAKGGILFNIVQEMKLPVRYIGVGEKAEDLQEFQPEAFVNALFER